MFILSIIALSVLLIQLVYLGIFIYAFSQSKPATPAQGIPVSVIIAAHDEEHNLRELIPLLLQQQHPVFEIIVIEDRCNDGTYDYLLEATRHHENLKMVRVAHKPDHINGKKYALTLGIKAAKYDWVLLTDADCRPVSKNWITQMSTQMCDGTQLVLGYSPYQKLPGLLNSFIRFESCLTGIQFIGLALVGRPYMGVGRNLAYRKLLFLENKGFNRYLGTTGGDDDLFVNEHATATNTHVCMGPEAIVESKPKTTCREFYYQKLRHLFVGKSYKWSDKVVLGLFSLTGILTWLLVLPVAAVSPWATVIGAAFLLRWILMIYLFHQAPRRLGSSFEAWKTPFLDFIYAFYYLVAGSVALVSKKVRWKI